MAAALHAQEGPGPLRVQARGPQGDLYRSGDLRAALSPLASFVALDARVGFAQRNIPVERGAARLALPPGIPAALALQGPTLHGWAGPFFAGQVVTLVARDPARLAVAADLPTDDERPARVLLRSPAPRGTGAFLEVALDGTAPGPLELPPFPPGPADLVLLVQGRAPLTRRIELEPGPATLRLSPPGGGALELNAVDPDHGTPLGPGGRLFLDGHLLPWATLSDQGAARITGIPADGLSHRIDLALPGREEISHWWKPEEAGAKARAVLRPRPALLLQGALRDPAGNPARAHQVVAAGMRVTAMGREPFSLVCRTDDSGRFTFSLPPTGTPGVLIVLGEAGPIGTLLTPPLEGPGSIDLGSLHLPAHPPLQGRLLGLSLVEAEGASVELLPAAASPIEPLLLHRRVPVAPDGAFSFLGAASGPHLLRARAPGRVGKELLMRLGVEREFLEIELNRGLVLTGRILFPDDKPAPGTLVRIQPLSQDLLPVLVSTDSEGRFLASGVPAAVVRVSAYLEHDQSSWSASVLVETGAGDEVRLTLFQEP